MKIALQEQLKNSIFVTTTVHIFILEYVVNVMPVIIN